MILKEQNYGNLNRKYYHGICENYKKSERRFEDIFLTTKKEYAIPYALRNGIVEVYRLKQSANIFNMLCKTDESNFREYCLKTDKRILRNIKYMKKNDWSFIDDDSYRNILIKIIKILGYDGFFNYEIDKKALKRLRDYGVFKYTKRDISSPAVCVFNSDILIKDTSFPVEILCDKDLEIDYIKEKARDYWSLHKDFSYVVKRLFEETIVLSETDIETLVYNILNNRDNEKFLKEQLRMSGLIKRAGIDYIEHIQKLEENGTMKEIYKKFM